MKTIRNAAIVTALTFVPAVWMAPGTVADVLLTVAAVLSWVFAMLYLTGSMWWLERVGRATISMMFALALVLTQNAMSVWWGENYPGRDQVRGLLYASLAYALARLVLTLHHIQRTDKETQNG
ncbi:hypothetical protein P3F83_18010 [Mycobacteroides immunogenum]|uniref:putative phage holin n=1 Tax=Mycobacteroides immunogenum TaxID=83262 RepID=UPI0025B768BC|nr:hypothetical protein [Mycobacteroides immunogenum]WJR32406.1 hypothetical protein P3F83_18010 [Mycobacteroides immunogenum]